VNILEDVVYKIWKTFGTFKTFEEADVKRKELESIHEVVKVRRSGKDGSSYKIKFWNEPEKVQKSKKKNKGKKNVDKTVRS
jgi:hypothetical protein